METCLSAVGHRAVNAHDRVAPLDARGRPTLSRREPTAQCVRPRRAPSTATHRHKRMTGERSVPAEERMRASDEGKRLTHTRVSMTEQCVGPPPQRIPAALLRSFASSLRSTAFGTCRDCDGLPTKRDTVARGTCSLTQPASPRSQRDHTRSQSRCASTLCRIWHARCARGHRPGAGRETHRAVAQSRRRAAPDTARPQGEGRVVWNGWYVGEWRWPWMRATSTARTH